MNSNITLTVANKDDLLEDLFFLPKVSNIQTQNKEGWTLLHEAAKRGHLNELGRLIHQEKISVNIINYEGRTPLHIAAQFNQLKITRFLLKHPEVDPQAQDKNGLTPLDWAAGLGHLETVTCLRAYLHGAKLDIQVDSTTGLTPLHIGAYNGHLPIVKYFICEALFDAQILDKEGRTPLYLAAWNGHLPVVEYLAAQKNVVVQKPNKAGYTPLYKAILNQHQTIADYLLNRARMEACIKTDLKLTWIHCAAAIGDLSVVTYLIDEMDVDINLPDENGWTPLHWATFGGHKAIVQYLVKNPRIKIQSRDNKSLTALHVGAQVGQLSMVIYLTEEAKFEVNIRDKNAWTPLHWAAYGDHKAIVQYLINKQKVKAQIKGHANLTPLHVAAYVGSLSVVAYLIEEVKVHINIPDENGWTPLHWAAYGGQKTIVKYLIAQPKVIVRISDIKGAAPIHYAAQKGHLSILPYLMKNPDKKEDNLELCDQQGSTPIHFAAIFDHLPIVEYLSNIVNIRRRDRAGCTALHRAAEHDRLKIVEFLVQKDREMVTMKNEMDRTPLYMAIEKGLFEVTDYFISHVKLDLQKKDNKGWTVLHFAAQHGYLAVVMYLIENAGMDPDLKDNLDWTPLHWAASKGHFVIIDYLVNRAKAKLDVKNFQDKTPLEVAEAWNQWAIAWWLRLYILLHKLIRDLKPKDNLADLDEILDKIKNYQGEKPEHRLELYLSSLQLFIEIASKPKDFNSHFVKVRIAKYFSQFFKALKPEQQASVLNTMVQYGFEDFSFYRYPSNPPKPLDLDLTGVQQLIFKKLRFDETQAEALKEIASKHVRLRRLDFDQVTWTIESTKAFSTLLVACQKSLQHLTLKNCQITDSWLAKYQTELLEYLQLEILDLTGNLLSYDSVMSFVDALKELKTIRLNDINLSDNRIQVESKTMLEPLIEKISALDDCIKSKLRIELTGNALDSGHRHKELLYLLQKLIEKSDLSVEALLESEFHLKYSEATQAHILKLKNQAKNIVILIDLEQEDMKLFMDKFTELRRGSPTKQREGFPSDAAVFNELKLIAKHAKPSHLFPHTAKSFTLFLSDNNAQVEDDLSFAAKALAKKVMDYHPEAPVKSLLHIHSFFKSKSLTSIKSLLMPSRTLTLNSGYVYLIANNKNHAMLAYEGLKKNGQRFLKVTELTVSMPNKDSSTSQQNRVYALKQLFNLSSNRSKQVKVEFFKVKDNENKGLKNLNSLIHYLQNHCTYVAFSASSHQIKVLDEAIVKDIENGVDKKYQLFITSKSSDEVQNCLKWAIDQINTYIFRSAQIKPTLYLPSKVVKELATKSFVLQLHEPKASAIGNNKNNAKNHSS